MGVLGEGMAAGMVGNGDSGSSADWLRAHEALSRLAKQRARADAEEGRWLLAALRSSAHVHLGFGGFAEYVERLLGYKPRSTQEKLRVAEALENLPLIADALEEGVLHWSGARELTRVAVGETEQEWLDFSRGKSVHELESFVAGKAPGDRPSAPARESARRHVLRFEVGGETLALFREALLALRRSTGQRLDDDAALLLMARHVLGGPRDDGRASYQVALSVCPECRSGKQQAGGELVPVDEGVLAMADCDAQHLDVRGPLLATAVTAEKQSGFEHQSADTGAGTDAALSRKSAHTGVRAKQTIPPATRRAVLHRDYHCCTVPGCRNAAFLDLHHVQPRSEGGGNEVDNLITLCGAHHRAAHRGQLGVTGGVARGIHFHHSDGSAYGSVVSPSLSATREKAFAALRALGFREREVTCALADSTLSEHGPSLTLDHILRQALERLTAAAYR
jgi:hypothetical protein